MTKILSIHLPSFHNAEHFKFHTNARNIVAKHNPQALGLQALYDPYAALIDKEDEAFKKIVKSELTEQIHALDKERDGYYTGLTGAVRHALKHYDAKVVAAATRVQIVLKTYGNPTAKRYDEETSLLYNLLQELNGKYAADVTAAAVSGWVQKLAATNEAFDALLQTRRGEYNERNDLVLRECRLEVDAAYNAIRERVNAGVVFEGPEKYAAFIKELNGLIAENNTALAMRKGRKVAAGADSTDSADSNDEEE